MKAKDPSLKQKLDRPYTQLAYQEKDTASLSAAKASRWNVVSMKQDWKLIFCPP